ncbi:DNA-binding protein [Cystobacter ferrugineus]|uniref:DNA-binding protein n=1 Tax=Cystobacter ferrugineus TaxID=83449 RepID=A0A1L9B266_9BACT|nr:DNA-binding protein [Cystobacter ferrugineus]OJH36365.1 DNA-binding protein [Cystobacter ferrugineus]
MTLSRMAHPSRLATRPRVLLGCLMLAAFAACGDPGSKPPTPSPATPIAQARARDNGTTVIVEGHVTVPPGLFSSDTGNGSFAIQDDTGGIYVKVAETLGFGLGDHVRVTGTLNEELGLRILESEPASIQKLEGTRQVLPKDVSTSELQEPNEGLLVRVSGNVMEVFKDESPSGYSLLFSEGPGWVRLFVHMGAGIDPETLRSLSLGQRIQVTGFVSQYRTMYEVVPRQPSDLVLQ